MTLSPDTIGMIIALFAFTATVLGGVGAMLAHQMKRVDSRFDRVDARIDRVEERLLGVEHELVDVKITIARLEGPPRRLQQL